jgi:hypothetical protein
LGWEFRENWETTIVSLTMTNKAIHPSVGFSGSEQKGPEDNPGLLPWRGLTALLPDLLNSAVIRPYKPCNLARGTYWDGHLKSERIWTVQVIGNASLPSAMIMSAVNYKHDMGLAN